ncbi:hypothetical protein KZP23_11880 [Echinicola marina]|uniref:hypothetical protein n=1 Tax=Echinicola marina TaxID=2859768 RepID=UPI001CF64DF8|nr:hypothetical protein [Echinicola marina]UCS95660.1 hypothetical protein KZP23_11880 [Echinicola marina]
MNAAELLSIIKKGNNLEKEDFKALIKLHETFPYFLVPKVLAAKYELNVSEGESKELLHWAAVQSPDRSWLKTLIEQDLPFLAEQQTIDEPQIVKDEEPVISDDRSDPTEREKEGEIEENPKPSPVSSSRAEVLKKLEENLSKLRNQEAEKTTIPKESKKEPPKSSTAEKPKEKSSKTAKRRQKTGDDLIETIKKKEKKVIKDVRKKEQIDIIKAFSKKEIKMATIKENEDSNKLQDLSVKSTQLSDKLLSESYAKLLTKQGKKDKAKEIYEKLILKFPKKKAYFADLIKELKD